MNKRKVICKACFIIILSLLSIPVFSQNKWLDAIGEIHPSLPKTELLETTKSYFEVAKKAQVGTEVIGRVSVANNSFEKTEFEIIGGSGASLFHIDKFVNSYGKHFGILKVKELPLNNQEYEVIVKATFSNGQTDTRNYTINTVENILAEKFFNFVHAKLSRSHRLYFPVTDAKVSAHLSKFNSNGTFSDLNYGLSKAGWEGLNNGAERINNMAMSYLNENSTFYKDEALKQKIYTALLFNANEFAKYRTQWYETHLWRNTDYIAGIGIRFFELLKKEMNSADVNLAEKAVKVYDAILDNCDNLFAERMDERPAIGNANRNHRLRSLVVRAAMSYDYNRALSDWELWYDKVDPRIPGFYPDGAINDLMELMETSFVVSDTYNNKNGFFPDGTICHHPAAGIQFTADAYGWEWLTEWSIPLANQFKNTRFQAQLPTYNTTAERILDAYRPLTFYGYLDMSVGGLDKDREKWGKRLRLAVNDLIEAKGALTVIEREDELRGFKTNLENEGYADPLSMSKAFWNIDYLIQRRPGYFASVKMISKRSRGLERGVDKKSNYYLGDGALFIRTNPDDYNGIESYFNWHAIPGTTAEQRLDELPPYAESAYAGANGTNTFAGVVSNGSIGFGAFQYERNHMAQSDLYSTVNANKGYFFFEDEIVALGNKIKRVRPGDSADILTILNQLEWKGDIISGQAGNANSETITFSGNDAIRQLKATQKPVWFYHGEVGYIIVPKENKSVAVELTAEARSPRWTTETATKKMFQLAINHGADVVEDSYQYYILPKTTIGKVKEFVQSTLDNNIKVLENKGEQMVVYNSKLNVLQAAFYEAGTLIFKNVAGENVQMSVDRPALVMMKDNGETIEFSVTDPQHSTTEPTIHVEVNIKLKGESFDESNNLSRIAFTHSTEEVYAGKPLVKIFEVLGRFLTEVPDRNENKPKLNVFFNRPNQTVQMNADSMANKMDFSLFSLSGQLMAKNTIDGTMTKNGSVDIFSTNGLARGLYMVEVKAETTNQCSKILIHH